MLRSLYYACESLIILTTTQNIEKARVFAKKIWERMEKFDKWYLSDIRLIITVLFMFPLDVAVLIGERFTKQLEPYHSLKDAELSLINLDVNLAVLLIDGQKYPEALSYLKKVIPLCKKYQKYNQLAIAYARKGIVLQKLGNIDEGISYLIKSIENSDESFLDPYHDLAVVYYENGRISDAKDILDKGRSKSQRFKEQTDDFCKILDSISSTDNNQ